MCHAGYPARRQRKRQLGPNSVPPFFAPLALRAWSRRQRHPGVCGVCMNSGCPVPSPARDRSVPNPIFRLDVSLRGESHNQTPRLRRKSRRGNGITPTTLSQPSSSTTSAKSCRFLKHRRTASLERLSHSGIKLNLGIVDPFRTLQRVRIPR